MRSLGRWAWALGPVVLYAATIVFVSSKSSLPSVRLNDKVMHFIEYAAFAFLINRSILLLRPSTPPRIATLAAILFASFFGVTDEIHQRFVPGRDASVYDLVADAAGSLVGAMAYAGWAGLRARLGERILGGRRSQQKRAPVARGAR